jgi:hypothetical protein
LRKGKGPSSDPEVPEKLRAMRGDGKMKRKRIGWLEGFLKPFEKTARDVISSSPKFKIKIGIIHYPPKTKEEEQLAKRLYIYSSKRQKAKYLIELTESLREIVSQNKSLKEAVYTTAILMYNAYEVGWPMTYSRIEQIKRGERVGSKIKRKQWALNVRDAIPERCKRPTDKIRYLQTKHKGENKPLRLSIGSIYIDSADEEGNERLVYKGPQGKESINIETFRTEYLTKKVGK